MPVSAPTSFSLSRRFVVYGTTPYAVFSWNQSGSVGQFLLQGMTAASGGEVVYTTSLGKKSRRTQTVPMRKKVGAAWKELKYWRIRSISGTDLSDWTSLDLSEWWVSSDTVESFDIDAWRGNPSAIEMDLWVNNNSSVCYLQIDWLDGAGTTGITVTIPGKNITLKSVLGEDGGDTGLYQINMPAAQAISTGQVITVTVKELTSWVPKHWLPLTYTVVCTAQAYPEILPATFSPVLEGLECALTIPVTAEGGEFWAITALPPGLSLDSSTGIISGTPTTPKNYVFSIGYSILRWSLQAMYSLVVVDTPDIEAKTFWPVIGETFSGQPGTNGQAAGTWEVVENTALPAGLSINATTGAITGKPEVSSSPASPGTLTTKLRAVLDTYGTKTGVQTFVVKQYKPPVALTTSLSVSLTAGARFSIPLSAGVDPSSSYYLLRDATVQFEMVSAQSWASIVATGTQTANLVGTAPSFVGTQTLQVRGRNSDGVGAAISIAATISLPTAPSISNINVTSTAGRDFTAAFKAVPGGVWEWIAVPSGCTANDNVLSGNLDTPNLYVVSATVTNAAGTDSAIVAIQILEDSIISIYPIEPEGGYIQMNGTMVQLLAVLPEGYVASGWMFSGISNNYWALNSTSSPRSVQININYDIQQTALVTISARLSGDTATVSRTFVVNRFSKPSILASGSWWNGSNYVTTNTYEVERNQSFNIGLNASENPTAWELEGSVASGVSISSSGILSGKLSDLGNYFFYVVASNSYGKSAPVVITVTVKAHGGSIFNATTGAVMGEHPEYTDIGVDVRSRSVSSSSLVLEGTNTTAKCLSWKHHDDATVCLFFTDGNTPATVESLRFGLRKSGEWEAEMLLEQDLDPAVSEDENIPYYILPFNVSSPALDDAMEDTDSTGILTCTGEVEWTTGGKTYSSQAFPVKISRDVLR